MRELEESFIGRGQVKGFKFTQIKKNDYGYIYKVEISGRVYYEVFKRKENIRFNCVSYPSSKAFGIWAWTTRFIKSAEEYLEDITIKGEEKEFDNLSNTF